ncbi:MAG TPA: desulfoferrodoxin [Aminobacterium sp.]|uniref:desulfoferrodoxin n=1 Tax=Aminobacterium TaxID=81466 RepID=UPI000EC0C1EB|nr:desulfoferrodoxin [Aminobacterium sp. UBA4834]HCA41561.1 desulfoferrodoxin [Aminobacterium sp.]
MTKRLEVYKCDLCGNVVEVLHAGAGQLVCCNQPMKLLEEQTADASTEKHVPVIEGSKVKVGSVPHPMKPEHYIEWIEVISGDKIYRQFLNPGDAPETEFHEITPELSREYCNIHGLWKAGK